MIVAIIVIALLCFGAGVAIGFAIHGKLVDDEGLM